MAETRPSPAIVSSCPACCDANHGLMRPLYTSCREHYRSTQHAQEKKDSIQLPSQFLTLTSIPTMLYTPPPPAGPPRPVEAKSSPFMRLPTEIRLQIYALLILPRRATDLLPSYTRVSASAQDHFDYDQKQPNSDDPLTTSISNPTIRLRTINANTYIQRYGPDKSHAPHHRTTYSVRGDRFRARCMPTTYHSINTPRIEDQLGILRTNKQIHAEAAELLYSAYTFDFDTHVEALVPFLNDLTPFARSCIQSLRIVKRPLAYEKEFDRAEWSAALRYLTSSSSGIRLRRLELGIVAGRPGEHGWDRIAAYGARDFGLLKDQEGMEWMQYLFELRGLKELDVRAVVEHCPPATNSMAMAAYIRFSASVDGGFAEFLRGVLMEREGA